jgi:hypothetical protein
VVGENLRELGERRTKRVETFAGATPAEKGKYPVEKIESSRRNRGWSKKKQGHEDERLIEELQKFYEPSSGNLVSTLDPRLDWEDTSHPVRGERVGPAPNIDYYDHLYKSEHDEDE